MVLKATAGACNQSAKRDVYLKKPWSKWDDDQRQEASTLYMNAGYKKCLLKYRETDCPPVSTLRDWGKKLAVQGCTNPIGRPGKLTHEESTALKTYFDDVRAEGASVDRECIALLAKDLVAKSRPYLAPECTPSFDANWARDFKRRYDMTWRSGDTDRAPSTCADIVADNEWRRQLLDVFANPAAHGIIMPEGMTSTPRCCRLAMDETPIHYFPSLKGTYEGTGVSNVYIAYSDEKRMITGSPVTDPDGNIFLFPLLWKGTTTLCHPKVSPTVTQYTSPLVMHDHAKKKTQTHATFERLCDEIPKRGIDVKRAANLPEDTPIVEVIDNVPSHIDRQQLTKVDDNLYRYKDTCLYLFLGRPNRSHLLNSGDQYVNVTLRAHLRQRSKFRLLKHCIDIREGKIPPRTHRCYGVFGHPGIQAVCACFGSGRFCLHG